MIRGLGRKPVPRQRVLMICMGNICRSPTAEGVLRERLSRAGLDADVAVDSAGTHGDYHAGEQADARARKHALARGYDLSRHRARRVTDEDFERADLVLAMDQANLEALEARCPPEHTAKLRLLTSFARRHAGIEEVPDPYYAGPEAFEHVLNLVEDACEGVVEHLRERLR